MKKKITLSLIALLTAFLFIGGTLAYLTDKDEVTNTFTVGKVEIKLDEAKVDLMGTPDENAPRVTENTYKLIPGHKYTKDPTVTVTAGSEECYVRMLVTVNNAETLNTIFAPAGGANLLSIFQGHDSTKWTLVDPSPAIVNDTRTYEFRYYKTVAAPDDNVPLEALFSGFTVPGTITGTQLDTLKDFTITVEAHAIQADGFETADAAWDAFTTE